MPDVRSARALCHGRRSSSDAAALAAVHPSLPVSGQSAVVSRQKAACSSDHWRLSTDYWACSSVGQSARLISVRSAVQIGPGPPQQAWVSSEDRGQRTENRKALWARLLRFGPRVVMEVRATDRPVCRLSSVLCSVDIVKRVVTVKQVRPSSSGGTPLG